MQHPVPHSQQQDQTRTDALAVKADDKIGFTLKVNGHDHRLSLDPRTTLLDALREHLHLTDTKKGCARCI